MVVLTTGETSTTGMLPVLSDTTVTGRDVPSVLSGVGESGRHLYGLSTDRCQVASKQECTARRTLSGLLRDKEELRLEVLRVLGHTAHAQSASERARRGPAESRQARRASHGASEPAERSGTSQPASQTALHGVKVRREQTLKRDQILLARWARWEGRWQQ